MGEFTITNHSNYAGSMIAELGVLGTNPSSAIAGQTGVVYDSSGNWMGDIRIRKDWPGNGSVLSIAEAGSGLIDWQSSSTMKVIDQYRPWLKHPRYNTATSQWMMDFDVEYDGQLNQWGPYSNPGTPIIALPASSGKWVVDFVGEDSFSLQVGINSYAWAFPDGQTVTSAAGTESSPIKMTFTGASPGGSYFSLTVTDSNGLSQIGRRLIFAINDISQLPAVQVSTITGGIETGGYQAQFMATGNPVSEITETNYPYLDNSELVVFEQARYGGTRASFGGNSKLRGDTVFRGWITGREMRVSPFSSDMSITAETINGIINRGDSYDVFLANYQSGGSAWTEVGILGLDAVTQFVLKWRSTLATICDWTPMAGLGDSARILYQSLPRSGLFDQLRSNYYDRGVLGYFASDMQSNLFAFTDMQLAGSSTSGSVALLHQDRRDSVTISSVPRDENAQVTLYAVASDIPYGAESPAHVRGYFGGERVHERGLLTDSQQTLITWTGNLRAKLNNKYPRVNVPMSNNMRIDPVPQSIVSMSMAASENMRGITWTGDKFVTKELNVSYDSVMGYPLFDFGFEKYTQGIGGSSITFPTIDDIVPLPTNPPPASGIDFPITPPITEGFGTGFGTVYVMTPDYLGRTRAFSATSPVYADITPGSMGIGYDYILDPWSPETTGYIATSAGIWKSSDLTSTIPTFTNVLTTAAIEGVLGAGVENLYKIICSINVQNYVTFFFNIGDALYNGRSYDGGTTWAYSLIANVAGGLSWQGAADYVPHLVNGNIRLYVAYGTTVVNRIHGDWARSDDGGATWSATGRYASVSGGAFIYPHEVHCPYHGNEDGDIAYIHGNTGAANGTLFQTTSAGTGWTMLVGGSSGLLVRRSSMQAYTLNNQIAVRWKSTPALYTTTNAFTSETAATLSGYIGTQIAAAGGFPVNSDQYYAVTTGNGAILVTTDNGENWTDKTGNWRTVYGITAGNPVTSGISVIVPLWTE